MNAPARPSGLARSLAAATTASAASAAAVVLGVISTKLIAVRAGPEGIALLGLYKGLVATATAVLGLGFPTILLQRGSWAKTPGERLELRRGAGLLWLLQGVTLAGAALAGAGAIAAWLLGPEASAGKSWEIRLVLLMAFFNLGLQLAVALLQGQGKVTELAVVQVAAALGTLLLIVPLLCLGSMGLAALAGAGSAAGVAAAIFFISRDAVESPPAGLTFRGRLESIKALLGPSVLLALDGAALMGGQLAVQALVNRSLGLRTLGAYNAALLLIDTTVMVTMASARSHFLPALARAPEQEKPALILRMLVLSLGVLTAAGAALQAAGPLLLHLLFSEDFLQGAGFLAVLSLSLPGHAMGWCYNTYLLHRGRTLEFVAMDLTWISLYLAGSWIALNSGAGDLAALGGIYACVLLLLGVLYSAIAGFRDPACRLAFPGVLLPGLSLACLLLVSRLKGTPMPGWALPTAAAWAAAAWAAGRGLGTVPAQEPAESGNGKLAAQ